MVSVLLALAADAWWEEQGELREEQRVLVALLEEMDANQVRLSEKRDWQNGILDATRALLVATSQSSADISPDSLDHLIGDASWWGGYTSFEMSAIDALLAGRGLAGLSDPDLRQALTDWRRRLEVVELNERQDYDAFVGVWMPFLREYGDLPQISNAIVHLPGSTEPNFGERIPDTGSTDHTPLLESQAFRNLLVQRLWVHNDILQQYDLLEPTLLHLVEILEEATGPRTS